MKPLYSLLCLSELDKRQTGLKVGQVVRGVGESSDCQSALDSILMQVSCLSRERICDQAVT